MQYKYTNNAQTNQSHLLECFKDFIHYYPKVLILQNPTATTVEIITRIYNIDSSLKLTCLKLIKRYKISLMLKRFENTHE